MGKVRNIDDYRPHVRMSCPDGEIHTVSIAALDDIIDGKRSLSDIEDGDQLIRAILADWLIYIDP